MTDNEIKKEYLCSYKNLYNKMRSLEEQIESLKQSAYHAKAQTLSDMPRGTKQSDLSDIMVRLDSLFTEIICKRAECLTRKIEIESHIAQMDDGIESMILHKRYIQFKEWEKICVEINYSWKHTHRLHSSALHNFKLPEAYQYTISSAS